MRTANYDAPPLNPVEKVGAHPELQISAGALWPALLQRLQQTGEYVGRMSDEGRGDPDSTIRYRVESVCREPIQLTPEGIGKAAGDLTREFPDIKKAGGDAMGFERDWEIDTEKLMQAFVETLVEERDRRMDLGK